MWRTCCAWVLVHWTRSHSVWKPRPFWRGNQKPHQSVAARRTSTIQAANFSRPQWHMTRCTWNTWDLGVFRIMPNHTSFWQLVWIGLRTEQLKNVQPHQHSMTQCSWNVKQFGKMPNHTNVPGPNIFQLCEDVLGERPTTEEESVKKLTKPQKSLQQFYTLRETTWRRWWRGKKVPAERG